MADDYDEIIYPCIVRGHELALRYQRVSPYQLGHDKRVAGMVMCHGAINDRHSVKLYHNFDLDTLAKLRDDLNDILSQYGR